MMMRFLFAMLLIATLFASVKSQIPKSPAADAELFPSSSIAFAKISSPVELIFDHPLYVCSAWHGIRRQKPTPGALGARRRCPIQFKYDLAMAKNGHRSRRLADGERHRLGMRCDRGGRLMTCPQS